MSTIPSDNIANTTHGKTAGRLEDHRFLTGQARFTADMDVEGQLYAIVVRSNHAHAAILDIDNSSAFEVEGVVGVHTITDLDNDGIGPMPCPAAGPHLEFCIVPPRPALARDRVRHVGDPIALVVAKTLSSAKLAAEKVLIKYAPLSTTVDIEAALSADKTLVWDQAPGNIAFQFEKGTRTGVDAVFAAADQVI